MSKKDYQAIARAIHETRCISAERPWDGERIIRAIADTLAADNPRFDRERFIEACETGECRGMRPAKRHTPECNAANDFSAVKLCLC